MLPDLVGRHRFFFELCAPLRKESKMLLESEPPMQLMGGKKQSSFTK